MVKVIGTREEVEKFEWFTQIKPNGGFCLLEKLKWNPGNESVYECVRRAFNYEVEYTD
jgi:hypothetical protein